MDTVRLATDIETIFNVTNSLPFVSAVTSPLRILAAKIQFIGGVVIGCASLIAQMVDKNPVWEHRSNKAFEHVVHGGLNFGRGSVETLLAIPALTFVTVGAVNIASESAFQTQSGLKVCIFALVLPFIPFIAQCASKNKFAPIVKYANEPVVSSEKSAAAAS